MSALQRWTHWLAFADLTVDDHPSFSKFCVVAILVWAIATNSLTLGIVITILAASFGRSVFLAFLKRNGPADGPGV